jgi:U32 family peptidase
MKHIELLAPAGSLEKLKYAIHYGADAVYCGVPDFSLRVRINQFSEKDIEKAAKYAHNHKKKIYITLNIYAHNQYLPRIEKHLKFLSKLGIDGVIVSDPGIINLVKKYLPRVDIHLSTQANATNWQAVKFWQSQGVKRIILAREVTLGEIREIREKVPEIELEYFIHGAMCMSYSGRCILSKWMTGRSANLGDCSQPCRWAYHETYNIKHKTRGIKTKRVVEELKGYEVDLEEDQHGTYFFNSYDLNLIEHVNELIKAGVDCLKIEGRAKSAYYAAIVTRAYRKVLDNLNSKSLGIIVKEQKKELYNLANRGYTTGFLLEKEPEHNFSGKMQGGKWKFVGEIIGRKNDLNILRIHNEIYLGDKIEAITPEKNIQVKIIKIYNDKMQVIKEAHGGHDMKYYFEFSKILPEKSLIRKKLK